MHRGLLVNGDVFSERYIEGVPRGADVVIDLVGGTYIEESVRCLDRHRALEEKAFLVQRLAWDNAQNRTNLLVG